MFVLHIKLVSCSFYKELSCSWKRTSNNKLSPKMDMKFKKKKKKQAGGGKDEQAENKSILGRF